jgi:hypothetical protein
MIVEGGLHNVTRTLVAEKRPRNGHFYRGRC